MFEKWRHTAAEGARKHPMWTGTVTPSNIWRMQEDISALASEVEALKEKIRKDGGRCKMAEKETLKIVLTEDQEVELDIECSLRTFITVIVTAIKEAGLSDDEVAKLFVVTTQRYFDTLD